MARRRAPALCALGLLTLPATATAAPPIPAPRAPQNPHLAPDPSSNIHDDTWMTDAYARSGPTGRRGLVTGLGPLPPSLCSATTFDSRGRIVTVCPSLVSAPVLRLIDPASLKVLAERTLPDAPTPKGTAGFQNFAGGGYFFLDDRDRVWSATKTNHLAVFRASAAGTWFAPVADYDLTRVVSRGERITSALPDFRGRIWFVTKQHGKVGVLNPRTRAVHVLRTGEEIENSFAVGRAGVYIVSDRRMYRFAAGPGGRPGVVWSARYRNSHIVKPSQVDAGSGTTPTLLPGGRVAITDNADPMDVVVYRTAARLPRHRRRVVCTQPVFGKGHGATENSLIGAGRSLIVENNFGYADPFGPQAGNITETGLARVDLRRGGAGCRRVWTNHTVRAPSVVPKLSTSTQLVYTYAQDLGPLDTRTWSWVGLSARTGREVFRRVAGTGVAANNNYAGIGLGPDGTAYVGTIGGIRTLRDAP
jgi:hypothetical protein